MRLYSEQDVMSKVVVPDLAAHGYKESQTQFGPVVLRFEYPIHVQQGREKKTIFADLVVFVNEVPLIVVDSKNPREYITDNDRDQVISYARLLDNIAPFAAICNGAWRVFDAVRKQQIRALPRLTDLLSDYHRRRLTQTQKDTLHFQAKRTLFAIDSVRDLSRLMRRCHDTIRNLRGYDPTRAFDELSKVLFAKMFEEREIAEGRRQHNRFMIESVQEMRKQGVEIIQQLWKETVGSDRYKEVFADEEAAQDIALPPDAIDKIVEMLQDKSLGLTDMDVKGVAFEEFLSSTYRGGGLGQYFTPREVVNFMVDLVEPAIGERVIDPSCGSGGFLIRVYDVVNEKILSSEFAKREKDRLLKELANKSLVGIDWEQRAARTCKMNMILHGDGHAGVYQANALDIDEVAMKVTERQRFYPEAPEVEDSSFDTVLTNPPFGAQDRVPHILQHYDLGKGNSQKREVLLLERQIRLLRPGGKLFVVLPEGILSNKRDRFIRKYILENCNVKAIIRLPQDAFKMSGGAACTSLLYAVKKDPEDVNMSEQGDIFFARAEYIGTTPAGKPIPENDLLVIREQYRRLVAGEWDGIEMELRDDGSMQSLRKEPKSDDLWLEPTVNRTSLLYDRLSYVMRRPRITDRFSYTYFHPAYCRTMEALNQMSGKRMKLQDLCVGGYPVRGQKPAEESAEGIPILKVRNVTGQGLDMGTEYTPDNEKNRCDYARGLVIKDDLLITSTGEGTIGRVDRYPYDDPSIADGHVTIVRLRPGVVVQYVLEFLRSEFGQMQMLRAVSGSTGQTELLIEYIRELIVSIPPVNTQETIVYSMDEAREEADRLHSEANKLQERSANVLAVARYDMMTELMQGDED